MPSYKNQSIDMQNKSIDCFLYMATLKLIIITKMIITMMIIMVIIMIIKKGEYRK